MLQVWNTELAKAAQTISETCVFEFNIPLAIQLTSFTDVGQNIIATTDGIVDYGDQVQDWFGQGADYDLVQNTCSSVCGAYVQVIRILLLATNISIGYTPRARLLSDVATA